MGKRMLFVGLGSAGQRHLRNLKRLYGDNTEIMAYRVRKLQRVFDDRMHIVEGKNLDDEYGITVFDDYDEALRAKPDVVFITNQNSRHMEHALKAAKAGCHLFIEKPLAVTMEGVDELDAEMKAHGKIAYVGYQNRLHPCVKKAKELLDAHKLGRIYMVYSELGEYLPGMHPWEDYRNMNEARQESGGGVVLCQLHELDYLYYLFGMPEEIYAVGGHRSGLEINVEDTATALCRYDYEGSECAVNVHLDFLQSPPTRHCKIAGEFGRFEFDLLRNEYKLYLTDGTTEEKTFSEFERNDMFLEELRIFMDAVSGRCDRTLIDINEGKKSLEFALKIKEAMKNGGVCRNIHFS